MNEAQVWMLTTALSAVMLSIPTLFVRVLRSEIGSVRSEIGSVRSEIQRVEQVLSAKFDHLDRDVRVIARKVFGDDPH